MRALVVGAGAIGQVYGQHLRAGGAEVVFLAKPSHVEEVRRGFTLYPLNRPPARRMLPQRVTGFPVVTGAGEIKGTRWDQVYLTMSSPALRSGDWFEELAAAMGSATLVLLQPGPDDRTFVLERVPAAQVVQGIISLMSYRAPLPGETRFPEPGVAYWLPPLAKSAMSGPRPRLAEVIASLRQGGLPVRRHRDVSRIITFPTALFMPLAAVLEEAGWSLSELRKGDRLQRAWKAGRQAMAVTARREGRRPPLLWRLVGRPLLVRAALRLAPALMPFDLEAYLRAHFTKVGDQTRDFLRGYLHHGKAAGLPVDSLSTVAPS
jgi:ketopantoate reductase